MNSETYGLRQDYFLSQFGESKRYAVISDEDLSNPEFLLDAIGTVRQKVMDMPRRTITDFYTDLYRDLEGCFQSGCSEEIFLDLEPLWDASGEWWRDTIQTPEPRPTALRLRIENKERIRLILSLHRASFPEEAVLWGIRPANDNG